MVNILTVVLHNLQETADFIVLGRDNDDNLF
jgi:hypothetical protein